MKKHLPLIVILVLGTALHFVYDLTGKNSFIGLFCPVSESVWEHFKLVLFPMIGFFVYNGIEKGYFSPVALFVSVVHSALIMFGIFYFYTAGLGMESSVVIDIPSYFVNVIVTYFMFLSLSERSYPMYLSVLAAALTALFVIYVWKVAYNPPPLPIFTDFSKKG